jgi:hypothetical protein
VVALLGMQLSLAELAGLGLGWSSHSSDLLALCPGDSGQGMRASVHTAG